jgi:hypothetical protein
MAKCHIFIHLHATTQVGLYANLGALDAPKARKPQFEQVFSDPAQNVGWRAVRDGVLETAPKRNPGTVWVLPRLKRRCKAAPIRETGGVSALLPVAEVAARFGIAEATLETWRSRG